MRIGYTWCFCWARVGCAHGFFSRAGNFEFFMVDGGNDYDGKWIEMFQVVVSSIFYFHPYLGR